MGIHFCHEIMMTSVMLSSLNVWYMRVGVVRDILMRTNPKDHGCASAAFNYYGLQSVQHILQLKWNTYGLFHSIFRAVASWTIICPAVYLCHNSLLNDISNCILSFFSQFMISKRQSINRAPPPSSNSSSLVFRTTIKFANADNWNHFYLPDATFHLLSGSLNLQCLRPKHLFGNSVKEGWGSGWLCWAVHEHLYSDSLRLSSKNVFYLLCFRWTWLSSNFYLDWDR